MKTEIMEDAGCPTELTQCLGGGMKLLPSFSDQLHSANIEMEDIISLHRQYIEAIQPYVRQKANIVGMQPARYVLDGDRLIVEIMGQSNSEELCYMIDQCIEMIGREIFRARVPKSL